MTDDHEVDDLRALWQQLETPLADDADDQSRFPETAAVMAELRSAWAQLEVPAAEPPKLGRRLEFPPALAAVAAVIIALVTGFAFAWNSGHSLPVTPSHLLGESSREDQPKEDNKSLVSHSVAANGTLEMRKGRVRLLLVTSTTDPNSESLEK